MLATKHLIINKTYLHLVHPYKHSTWKAASTQKMLTVFSNELNKNLGLKYFTWWVPIVAQQ